MCILSINSIYSYTLDKFHLIYNKVVFDKYQLHMSTLTPRTLWYSGTLRFEDADVSEFHQSSHHQKEIL